MTSRSTRSMASGTTSSPAASYPRRFCLDANLSYKVAQALTIVELPFVHVAEALPTPPGTPRGRQPRPDSDVAKWCGQTSHVLVTIDTDFHTRWIKTGLLAAHGVEVVVFSEDLKGLTAQHARVTRHYPYWQSVLGRGPYLHRVWMQTTRLEPGLIQGKQARRRSRQPRSSEPAQPSERSSTAGRA